MNTIPKIAFVAFIAATLISCGQGAKEKKGAAGDAKIKLEQLKKEKTAIDAKIRALEEEIARLDPAAAQQVQRLVSADTLAKQSFSHYIELQAKIDADNIVYVTPRGQPAQVKELYIKKGEVVRKGQLLAKLDDAIMLQQVDALKTQLAQAEDVYRRYKSLWDQGVGMEINVINAKNQVDNLKNQIQTMNETWKTSFVYAPISGSVEELNLKAGETFMGMIGQTPQIKIVNNSNLKVVAEVPENYISSVRKGDAVLVDVPETGKPSFKSVINVVGATVDPTKRSFAVEGRLPSDPMLKANQLATMKILDYKIENAVVVPVNVVQNDEKGKFVYVIEKSGNKMVAVKKQVTVGESYNGQIEIRSGLNGGEVIITDGYQTVYDGQSVTTGSAAT